MKLRWALLLILTASVVIWAPSLFIAEPGYSFSYTLNWSQQFTQQFLAGNAYPRWTAGSFGGLGAPTFYFYPPLPFWTVAVIDSPMRGLVTASDQVKLAALAFLALSGLTMFAWLRTRANTTTSLLGAVLFMVAPYHFDDHYVRGAFAEFAAFCFLPVVGLGLAWTAQGRRLGIAALAAGWSGVIFCHLPTALLSGTLLVAPYGAFLLWEARSRFVAVFCSFAFAITVGTGLAAVYVVPSLALQDAISAEYWWSAQFQISDRLFANPASWRLPLEPLLGFVSLAEAAIATVIGWRARRGEDRQLIFWAGAVVGLFLVMAGLVPGFWSLPLMAKVQFPWRAMALQDFAFVTLFAWAPPGARTPMVSIVLAALIAGNVASVVRADLAPTPPAAASPASDTSNFPTDADPPEYLPNGTLRMTEQGPATAVAYAPLVAGPLVTGPVTRAASDPVFGAVRMQMAEGQQGLVVLKRFYFPAWKVSCEGDPVRAFAVGQARLLGFLPPPARRSCEAEISTTPSEQLGAAVSYASLFLLAVYGVRLVIAARRKSAQASTL